MAKAYDEKKKALRILAWYEDFDGGLDRWKESFYTLWRCQLTWDFAYSITLRETRSKGVYVSLLIKPAYKDSLLDNMEDFGYRNVEVQEEPIGLIYGFDRYEELKDIEEVFIDY